MPNKTANRNLKVYSCAECGDVKISNTTPSKDKCRRYNFHRWMTLGEVGSNTYTCSNCKITVKTAKTPATYGCRETRFHKWEKTID